MNNCARGKCYFRKTKINKFRSIYREQFTQNAGKTSKHVWILVQIVVMRIQGEVGDRDIDFRFF